MRNERTEILRQQLISNLRILMDARGENPTSLALKAGLNHRAVHDILQGRSLSPRADTLRALSLALVTAPDALLSGQVSGGAVDSHGVGGHGSVSQAVGAIGAAYQANADFMDGVPTYSLPAYMQESLSKGGVYALAQAPGKGFAPLVQAGSWVLLDRSEKARTEIVPALYWLSFKGEGLLARLLPDLTEQAPKVQVTLGGDGAERQSLTLPKDSLKIQARVQAAMLYI